MFREARRPRELPELADRIPAEAPEQVHRHERVAGLEEPLADRIGRAHRVDEEELEGVRVRADRLQDRLPVLPVGDAPVGARERAGWVDEPDRPGKRQDEHATQVGVRAFVGEPPCARPDRGLEDYARPQGVPVCGTLLRESHLSWATRQELLARVPDDADAGDLDVEAVVADRDDSPDAPLRDAAVPERPLDAGRHLGAVRQRHGQRIDRREPFWVMGIHSARVAAAPGFADAALVSRTSEVVRGTG